MVNESLRFPVGTRLRKPVLRKELVWWAFQRGSATLGSPPASPPLQRWVADADLCASRTFLKQQADKSAVQSG